MKFYQVLIGLLLLVSSTLVNAVQLGNQLPPVEVTDKGELLFQDNRFSYQPWSSAQLPGKVRVIIYMAGRLGIKQRNQPLINALSQAAFPHDRYQTTTIVDTDDVIFGSGIIVRSNLESNKKDFPWSQIIADAQGVVRQTWNLQPKSSLVVLLNKQGEIKFWYEDALKPQQIEQLLTQTRQLLEQED